MNTPEEINPKWNHRFYLHSNQRQQKRVLLFAARIICFCYSGFVADDRLHAKNICGRRVTARTVFVVESLQFKPCLHYTPVTLMGIFIWSICPRACKNLLYKAIHCKTSTLETIKTCHLAELTSYMWKLALKYALLTCQVSTNFLESFIIQSFLIQVWQSSIFCLALLSGKFLLVWLVRFLGTKLSHVSHMNQSRTIDTSQSTHLTTHDAGGNISVVTTYGML